MGTWPPPQASPEGLTKEGGPEEAWGGRGFAILNIFSIFSINLRLNTSVTYSYKRLAKSQ